jgi:hypothetical protein
VEAGGGSYVVGHEEHLVEAIGIEVTEFSAERVVATMPVYGPTLP